MQKKKEKNPIILAGCHCGRQSVPGKPHTALRFFCNASCSDANHLESEKKKLKKKGILKPALPHGGGGGAVGTYRIIRRPTRQVALHGGEVRRKEKNSTLYGLHAHWHLFSHLRRLPRFSFYFRRPVAQSAPKPKSL